MNRYSVAMGRVPVNNLKRIDVLVSGTVMHKPANLRGTLDQPESVAEQFQRHALRWREETEFLSSLAEILNHADYQAIIQLGPAALPLIFDELQQRPDHWFGALEAITGENPIPVEARGDLEQMTAAWLKWATQHGY
jgi:hypothetical protein